MTSPASGAGRAHVVGLGLIGASLALALADRGWSVSGWDVEPAIRDAARGASIIDGDAIDPRTSLVVIAVPAGTVAAVARDVLAQLGERDAVVTDVAGVKASTVAALDDPRFLGGHPMAGSEQRGLAGARADLFQGCTWVLTPTARTRPETYGRLHGILRDLGANVVAVPASDHDRLVAVASHVPHLLAGALMNEAALAAQQDAVLLQLAAGGFRDMTRIAAGDPRIWPDILMENREAIVPALRSLSDRLARVGDALEAGDVALVTRDLQSAAHARRQLPGRALDPASLRYLRVAVTDRPGVLAAVTVAASELSVNIYDIEIAHGIEGASGTLLLAVDAQRADVLHDALCERGFTVSPA